MFLSTYENNIDKKGRVSVPAQFRSHLSSLGFNSIICFPSFNQQCLEAWPQDRIEKISDAIDNLNPFEEKKDYFATSILSESVNLIFDTEGRISLTKKLLQHSKIKTKIVNCFKYCFYCSYRPVCMLFYYCFRNFLHINMSSLSLCREKFLLSPNRLLAPYKPNILIHY